MIKCEVRNEKKVRVCAYGDVLSVHMQSSSGWTIWSSILIRMRKSMRGAAPRPSRTTSDNGFSVHKERDSQLLVHFGSCSAIGNKRETSFTPSSWNVSQCSANLTRNVKDHHGLHWEKDGHDIFVFPWSDKAPASANNCNAHDPHRLCTCGRTDRRMCVGRSTVPRPGAIHEAASELDGVDCFEMPGWTASRLHPETTESQFDELGAQNAGWRHALRQRGPSDPQPSCLAIHGRGKVCWNACGAKEAKSEALWPTSGFDPEMSKSVKRARATHLRGTFQSPYTAFAASTAKQRRTFINPRSHQVLLGRLVLSLAYPVRRLARTWTLTPAHSNSAWLNAVQ